MTVSIFDIDNENRILWTGNVKRACGQPSFDAWAKARSILKITRRLLTAREAVLLFVATQVLKWRKKVDKAMVYEAAVKVLEHKPDVAWKIPKLAGIDGILGIDIADQIFEAIGVSLSVDTLYAYGRERGMPSFSIKTTYTSQQVTRFINRARRKSSRRKSAV